MWRAPDSCHQSSTRTRSGSNSRSASSALDGSRPVCAGAYDRGRTGCSYTTLPGLTSRRPLTYLLTDRVSRTRFCTNTSGLDGPLCRVGRPVRLSMAWKRSTRVPECSSTRPGLENPLPRKRDPCAQTSDPGRRPARQVGPTRRRATPADDLPAFILIKWPPAPSVASPDNFADLVAAVFRVLADARTTLSRIRGDRRPGRSAAT